MISKIIFFTTYTYFETWFFWEKLGVGFQPGLLKTSCLDWASPAKGTKPGEQVGAENQLPSGPPTLWCARARLHPRGGKGTFLQLHKVGFCTLNMIARGSATREGKSLIIPERLCLNLLQHWVQKGEIMEKKRGENVIIKINLFILDNISRF